MSAAVRELAGVRVLLLDADGPAIARERDASDLLSDAWEARAGLIAVPVERCAPEFWSLSSGLLGTVVQKLVNYRMRVAFVGDLGAQLAASKALTDYVREANKRADIWFVPDLAALEARLAG